MHIKKCLPKITAFITALDEHGVTNAAAVREHFSMIVGCSLAANHVAKTNCFTIDTEAQNAMSNLAWNFNNVYPINYDLAIARARDVIYSAYNHITSKGHTTCTTPTITLGETEVSLMDIPEGHALFLAVLNTFSDMEEYSK